MFRTHVWKGFGLGAALVFAAVGSFVGCSGDDGATGAPGAGSGTLLVGRTSDFLGTADWTTAVNQTVTLREISPTQYEFDPPNLVFEAGVPVILTIVNPSANTSKHYYTAADFYKSVAWRKAQTPDAEYKAPYFKAFEMKTGSSDTTLELFFIPIETGTYPVICTIPGHYDFGMSGFITVTGNVGNAVDQEVSTTWNSALETDARTSGGDTVWLTATTQTISITETPFTFSPLNPTLTRDVGYLLQLTNAANSGAHYYTASDFYETCVTRKADDANAEIKVPYFKAVELRSTTSATTSTTLYLVPTESGIYDVECTIAGHKASGMDGTITVPVPLVINDTASALVGAADWSTAVTQTVQMIELGGGLREFRPANLVFEAGKPVILTIESQFPNVEKHYYTATEFYKSVAWRKAETVDAHYEAPYFKAFELLVPLDSANPKEIELYFIPVEPGVYPVECTITGHADSGMVGTITVIGNYANTVDQEVSPTWDRTVMEGYSGWSSNDPEWTAPTTVVVDMVENASPAFPNPGSLEFFPADITLTKDTGYILTINNPAGNVRMHHYTALAFYETCVTRKAQDSQAEIKVPYFKSVDMRTSAAGTSTTVYLVPKTNGTYPVICTVTDHEVAGMDGTITVQ